VSSVTVVTGGVRAARDAAVAERVQAHAGAQVEQVNPAGWPFLRSLEHVAPGAAQVLLVARRIDEAFPDAQTGGTRLVLTQSTYQLQRWIDWMDARGNVALVADARASNLRRRAPEAFACRGPWARVERVDLPGETDRDDGDEGDAVADEPYGSLAAAFRVPDPDDRLARCRRAAAVLPDDAAVQLALGSVLMEVRDLDASQLAIARAIVLAPEWEAAHFELGKLHLRRDDIEGASRAFAEASRLMPSFSAAWSNLGATLGELDRPDEALNAFHEALRYDPNGYTVLNNVGVVSRELGRLNESEAAFRKVVALAPDFVFGHYNLGHTLFLQGRYQAALSAYLEGQRRDPEKNARQACRLAVARLAAGDAEGSLRDLRRCTAALQHDQKREVLAEAQEILWALLTDRPELAGWKQVADVVKAELDRI
jgi:tetratricopeptide (TPR) repeat protein